MLCELHAADNLSLRHLFARDPQVQVHRRSAWEALGALLPPAERRGLVLIDPPYEAPDEFARVAAGLRSGLGRFAGGVFAAWYPIKHRAPVRAFHAAIRDERPSATWWPPSSGCASPPTRRGSTGAACWWSIRRTGFEAEAPPILEQLLEPARDRRGGRRDGGAPPRR